MSRCLTVAMFDITRKNRQNVFFTGMIALFFFKKLCSQQPFKSYSKDPITPTVTSEYLLDP